MNYLIQELRLGNWFDFHNHERYHPALGTAPNQKDNIVSQLKLAA